MVHSGQTGHRSVPNFSKARNPFMNIQRSLSSKICGTCKKDLSIMYTTRREPRNSSNGEQTTNLRSHQPKTSAVECCASSSLLKDHCSKHPFLCRVCGSGFSKMNQMIFHKMNHSDLELLRSHQF